MVAAAIADNPGFRLSTIELERDGPSYTVDTLDGAGRRPASGRWRSSSRWTRSLGLPTWREPERVLELATLVVAPRDGFEDAPADFLASATSRASPHGSSCWPARICA